MRLGIVGTGMIVQEVLPILRELAIDKIYLLARKESAKKAEDLCAQYGLTGYYTELEDMLKAEIDTVYVAVPNHLHYSFAKAALEAGKHVIVEKPMVFSPEQLDELMQIREEKDVFLLEAMNVSHLPAFQSLKKAVSRIGSIRIVNLNFSQYSSRYDAFRRGEILPAFDVDKAGGALMDINVYNLYFLAALFGKPEHFTYYPNVQRRIDTSGIAVLDYGSFTAAAVGAKDCSAATVSSLQGEDGYIRLEKPVNQLHAYSVFLRGSGEHSYTFEAEAHRLSYAWKEFFRIIESGDRAAEETLLDTSHIVCEMLAEGRQTLTEA